MEQKSNLNKMVLVLKGEENKILAGKLRNKANNYL